ncbi:MAG: PIG-L deacetylase family protein [bacterium]
MKILVIAAHPDDEVYGVGGTIVKHIREGDEVFVCILTDGASTQYPGNKTMIKQKKEEARKSTEILGIKKIYFFDLPDMQLDTIAHVKVNKAIEEMISRIMPDIVYTHYWGDVNKDHRVVFESTMVAVRPSFKHTIKRILLYETPSSSEWNAPILTDKFIPNVYVDISETISKKIEAMKAYESELREFPHPRSIEAVTTYVKKNGLVIAKEAAECFLLIRETI